MPHRPRISALLLVAGVACTAELDRSIPAGEIRGSAEIELADGGRVPAAQVRVALEGSRVATRSDASGRFALHHLPAGRWTLRLTRTEPGEAPLALVLPGLVLPAGDGLDLGHVVLQAHGALGGRVTRDGAPVSARVLIQGQVPLVTAADGTFESAGLAAADYGIAIQIPGGPTPLSWGRWSLTVKPRVTTRADLVLAGEPLGPANVTAAVHLPGAADQSGVEVTLVSGDASVTLDANAANGRVEGEVPPGIYSLVARRAGFVPLVVEHVLVAGLTELPPLLLLPTDCTAATAACPETDAQDTDGDGIANALDNCVAVANTDQADVQPANGLGDACEPARADDVSPAAPTFEQARMVTTARTLTVRGTSEPGARLELFAGTACSPPAVTSAAVTSSGSFELTLTLVPDRAATWTAQAIDLAGNRSACSSPLVVVQDERPPEAPNLEAPSPWEGRLRQPVVAGAAEPLALVLVHDTAGCSGEPVASTAAGDAGRFAVSVDVPANTATTLSVRARDEAGHLSPCSSDVVYVHDDVPPDTASLVVAVREAVAGFVAQRPWTVEWTGAPSDARTATVNVSLAADCRGELLADHAVTSGSMALLEALALDDATTTFVCVALADLAGNASLPRSLELITDFTPPAPATPALVADSTVSWDPVSDTGAGVASYSVAWCAPAGGCVLPASPGLEGLQGTTATLPLPPCVEHDVRVRAVDAVGNEAPWSVPLRVRPPLAAPFVTVAPGFGTVGLRWSHVTGATSYVACVGPEVDTCVAGQRREVADLASLQFTGTLGARAVSLTARAGPSCESEPRRETLPALDLVTTSLAGSEPAARLGAALVALPTPMGGGRPTFAVGSPGAASGAGAIAIVAREEVMVEGLVTITSFTPGAAGDACGTALALSDDSDGDGFADLLVGCPLVDCSEGADCGAVEIYSGRSLVWLGRVGFDRAGARFGSALASLGDVDADGSPDVLVGAPGLEQVAPPSANVGSAFVVSGSGLLRGDLVTLDSSQIRGHSDDAACGTSVARARDVDADGRDDLLVGCPGDPGLAGAAGGGVVELRSGAAGNALLASLAGSGGAGLGAALASVGDVDGDGREDWAAGAPAAGGGRGALVVFTFEPAASPEASVRQVFTLEGAPGDALGTSVASAGDFDADGSADVLVGAPGADVEPDDARGAVLVVSGRTGKPIWRQDGQAAGDGLHAGVGLGSVSAWGRPVLAVGAPLGAVAGSSNGYVLVAGLGRDRAEGPLGVMLGTAVPPLLFEAKVEELRATGTDYDGPIGELLSAGTVADWEELSLSPGPAPSLNWFRWFATHGPELVQPIQVRRSLRLVDPAPAGSLGDFGAALVFCDVAGDGIPELVVASPEAGGGAITAFDATSAGPPVRRLTSNRSGFGAALACLGDIDGAPGDELAVGVPGADDGGSRAGRVEVYGAGPTPIAALDGAGTDDRLGGSLLAADVSGDSRLELVVGSPSRPGGARVAALEFDRGTSSLVPIWDRSFPTALAGGSLGDLGDVEGNGRSAIAVGDQEHGAAGAVHVLSGVTGAPLLVVGSDGDRDGWGAQVVGSDWGAFVATEPGTRSLRAIDATTGGELWRWEAPAWAEASGWELAGPIRDPTTQETLVLLALPAPTGDSRVVAISADTGFERFSRPLLRAPSSGPRLAVSRTSAAPSWWAATEEAPEPACRLFDEVPATFAQLPPPTHVTAAIEDAATGLVRVSWVAPQSGVATRIEARLATSGWGSATLAGAADLVRVTPGETWGLRVVHFGESLPSAEVWLEVPLR